LVSQRVADALVIDLGDAVGLPTGSFRLVGVTGRCEGNMFGLVTVVWRTRTLVRHVAVLSMFSW
jgi:hypothetical protein